MRRDLPPGRYPMRDVVTGPIDCPALAEVIGGPEAVESLLDRTEVLIKPFEGYMWVDPDADCVVISHQYLREAEDPLLYLDFVHELVHVWQLDQGRELFDRRYSYDQRPTELQAYRVTVAEARRLGLDDGFLAEYLRVEWIDEAQHRRLLEVLDVNSPGSARS